MFLFFITTLYEYVSKIQTNTLNTWFHFGISRTRILIIKRKIEKCGNRCIYSGQFSPCFTFLLTRRETIIFY